MDVIFLAMGKTTLFRFRSKGARALLLILSAFFILAGSSSTSRAALCCPYLFPYCTCLVAGAVVTTPGFTAAKVSKTATEKAQWLVKLEKWAEDIALFTQIASVFQSIWGVFKKIKKLLYDDLGIQTAVTHVDKFMNFVAKEKEHQDQKETNIQTVINGEVAERIMKNTASDSGISAACNTITVGQGPAAMYSFALFCENVVTAGTEALFREPGSDGAGPQYARFAWEMTCPSQDEKNPRKDDTPTGLKQMGFPDACIPADEDFQGADWTARMISGDVMPLQMPPLIDETVTLADGTKTKVKIPKLNPSLLEKTGEEKSDAIAAEAYLGQQAFLAAWKGCIRALGPKDSPVTGKKMTSMDGVNSIAKWAGLSARESMFISQCARRMCQHTRPSCGQKNGDKTGNKTGDETFDGVCADSTRACDAAFALGADLPFNCRAPMTKFQAEYAAHAVCLGREAGVANASGPSEEANSLFYECTHSLSKWKTKLERERTAFVEAMDALASGSGRFPDPF